MGERFHRNRPIEELGKMSFAILQTIFRKLEKEKILTINIPYRDIMISQGLDGLVQTTIHEKELPPKIQFAPKHSFAEKII